MFFYPYILGDAENFKQANPLVTPVHIKPEWYFLFVYAILRSIPNKLGGAVALVFSIFIVHSMASSLEPSNECWTLLNFKNAFNEHCTQWWRGYVWYLDDSTLCPIFVSDLCVRSCQAGPEDCRGGRSLHGSREKSLLYNDDTSAHSVMLQLH